LPRRLARALGGAGHDAVHTLDLAKRNRTPDSDVRSLATRETRVVVTKDEDFVTSYLLKGSPPKLLLISTGNISNDVLLSLVTSNLPTIEAALLKHDFVELSRTAIIIHV
jgi:predicted nuclease of predicted toxin-antitoxin system